MTASFSTLFGDCYMALRIVAVFVASLIGTAALAQEVMVFEGGQVAAPAGAKPSKEQLKAMRAAQAQAGAQAGQSAQANPQGEKPKEEKKEGEGDKKKEGDDKTVKRPTADKVKANA